MTKRLFSALALIAFAATAPTRAHAEDFATWLDGVKRDAAAAGVPAAAIEIAFQNVTPLPRVIELDQRQPEKTLSFEEYLARILVPARIEQGRALLKQHATLLKAVQAQYGVPSKTVLALWAMESSFGKAMGDFRVVDALATLAYDGRRPDLFRSELIAALKILGRGRFRSADLKGSWAGAMGQTQFMPSTYLKYAVVFRHEGDPDIWHDTGDVFASASNYLARLGWKEQESWGREVKIPARLDPKLIGLETKKSVAEWAKYGVKRADGGMLPASSIEASLVQPDGPGHRAFLVYDNFRTVMKWNRSTYFGLAVGLLGDAIGGR